MVTPGYFIFFIFSHRDPQHPKSNTQQSLVLVLLQGLDVGSSKIKPRLFESCSVFVIIDIFLNPSHPLGRFCLNQQSMFTNSKLSDKADVIIVVRLGETQTA